jgi:hypothetical protein
VNFSSEPGIFVDQILSLLENDGPCIFELFERETNLGKKYSVNTMPVLMRVRCHRSIGPVS